MFSLFKTLAVLVASFALFLLLGGKEVHAHYCDDRVGPLSSDEHIYSTQQEREDCWWRYWTEQPNSKDRRQENYVVVEDKGDIMTPHQKRVSEGQMHPRTYAKRPSQFTMADQNNWDYDLHYTSVRKTYNQCVENGICTGEKLPDINSDRVLTIAFDHDGDDQTPDASHYLDCGPGFKAGTTNGGTLPWCVEDTG